MCLFGKEKKGAHRTSIERRAGITRRWDGSLEMYLGNTYWPEYGIIDSASGRTSKAWQSDINILYDTFIT